MQEMRRYRDGLGNIETEPIIAMLCFDDTGSTKD